jgi:putative two-component system response regulator
MNDGRRGNILIVDDIPENLRVLSKLLVGSGHKPRPVASGTAALRAVDAEHPDLILLDVMMPEMDGYEVCTRLKRRKDTAHIPIIFITALSETGNETKGFDCGAVDYITKPFSAPVVESRVGTHLALKWAHDELENRNEILEVRIASATESLRIAYGQIKALSNEAILRLSRAAEFRDTETANHLVRMARYAGAIARQMGMSSTEVEDIVNASPMHDIGKIGIPDSVLLKPGKLTPSEWRVMQQHTEVGRQILLDSEMPLLKLGATIAWTHHERWDGKGYPQQLGGDLIPLVGRIVAVADVFDALTSKRPYKDAFPVERAFKILEEEREHHFDPRVVDAFFAAQVEILAIKARCQDERVSHLQAMEEMIESAPNGD